MTRHASFSTVEKDVWCSGGVWPNLSCVERFVTGVVVVEEEHVDEGNEETRGVLGYPRVVREPLVEDQNGQVAEQAGHEDNLWDESQVDIKRLLEIPKKKFF